MLSQLGFRFVLTWVKGPFHEPTNQEATTKKKLISMTDLIGRPTNVVWSFLWTVVIDTLVADQLNFYIVL